MPRGFISSVSICVFAVILLVLIPILDTLPNGAQNSYGRVLRLFQQGYLVSSQDEAEAGYKQFERSSPFWAARFKLLQAESMLNRGMYDDALRELASLPDAGEEGTAEKYAIETVAFTRQNQVSKADERLAKADAMCMDRVLLSCGDVLSAHAIFAIKQGQLSNARQYFLDELAFARSHKDSWLQASAALNLGYMAMQVDHFDEAVDWFHAANQYSIPNGYKYLLLVSAGNLGWAYYQLGDRERALEQFRQAEDSAETLGAVRSQLKWLSTAGYTYEDSGDWTHALDSFRRSLFLAKQIGSKEDTENALKDLAMVSAESGETAQASDYLNQITQMEGQGAGDRSPQLRRTKCVIAAARRQTADAELCFRTLQSDESLLVSYRLDAGNRLAELLESEGNIGGAEQTYRSSLDLFASARAALKSEETELPFGANASRIYDSYIHLLMQEGRTTEALATADESRAGTLERGLEKDSANLAHRVPLDPTQIAKRTGGTLLFYWLGARQSYLWAITPSRIATFNLPPRQEIADRVNDYSRKIVQLHDPQKTGDRSGIGLYKLLVAPAAALIRPTQQLTVLADGELNQLNFETLLVPDAKTDAKQAPPRDAPVHYLIDDVTLVSAPSLAMLQAANAAHERGGKILLLGDPVSPNAEFPALPLFGLEMNRIESHFEKDRVSAVAGQQATPVTYLDSNPAQYAYIHFVSHAIANRIVPLDSAIVLSKSSSDENSFKLYARDIIQHPIDARLVTISACYGNGTRFYAGEGLVGLSWAFLHAGAQRVIGALWEVSDESTPRLMDALYRNIADGNSPEASLRKAKLALLHSQSRFSLPFYWATFQIYDRQ